MLSFSSISEIPMSSYLDLLLSGQAYELVMYISDRSNYIVYITSDVSLKLSVLGGNSDHD